MKRIALIDVDSVIYKAGCANETRWYVIYDGDKEVARFNYKKEADGFMAGNPELSARKEKEVGRLAHSLANAKNCMESMFDEYQAAGHQVYIKGSDNFRKGLYPEYKMNRSPEDAPLHEKEIRDYLIKHWDAIPVDGEEADDKVSYIQCSDLDKYCILGIDKDLWNTPGEHFNYDTKVVDFVTHEQANRGFWKQMLTGDRTDNIPGIPGVGPAGAEKVLSRPNTRAQVMYEYKRNKLKLSYMILMGRLLWLRRSPEEMWDLKVMNKYEVPV